MASRILLGSLQLDRGPEKTRRSARFHTGPRAIFVPILGFKKGSFGSNIPKKFSEIQFFGADAGKCSMNAGEPMCVADEP
jgi:hypothetical protein